MFEHHHSNRYRNGLLSFGLIVCCLLLFTVPLSAKNFEPHDFQPSVSKSIGLLDLMPESKAEEPLTATTATPEAPPLELTASDPNWPPAIPPVAPKPPAENPLPVTRTIVGYRSVQSCEDGVCTVQQVPVYSDDPDALTATLTTSSAMGSEEYSSADFPIISRLQQFFPRSPIRQERRMMRRERRASRFGCC